MMSEAAFKFVPPPQCPIFEPNDDDFKDPLLYIAKIKPIAEKFGICKIKPPPHWRPPFAVNIDKVKFTPRLQKLNELEATTRLRLNFLDQLARFWNLRGFKLRIPQVDKRVLDLYSLYKAVKNEGGYNIVIKERKWTKISIGLGYPPQSKTGGILRQHYEKILLPFHTFKTGESIDIIKNENSQDAFGEKEATGDSNYVSHSTSLSQQCINTPNQRTGLTRRAKRTAPEEKVTIDFCSNNELKKLQFYGAGPKLPGVPTYKDEKEQEKSMIPIITLDETEELQQAKSTTSILSSNPLIPGNDDISTVQPLTLDYIEREICKMPATNSVTIKNFQTFGDNSKSEPNNNFYPSFDSINGNYGAMTNPDASHLLSQTDMIPSIYAKNDIVLPSPIKSTGSSHISPLEKSKYQISPTPFKIENVMCKKCGLGNDEAHLLICDDCNLAYHTYCLVPIVKDIPQGEWFCPTCIVNECKNNVIPFGFEQSAKEYTLHSFGEMADEFKSTYFNMPFHMVPTITVEREFWRLVSSIVEDVTVCYGADLHCIEHGSGFPTEDQKDRFPGQEEYIYSPWNLNNLPVMNKSILKYISGDISGMKVPWMYVGMCFSTFCWHTEDHWSYSINYLHWGEPKTWYGVPESHAEMLEQVMKAQVPELFELQNDLLHHLVTLMNPNILMANSVPVVRCDQYPGEFMVTFPRSYHAGFNQGYNLAEAVNFCPADWIPIGRNCIAHYRDLKRQCVFSHEELICKMASSPEHLETAIAVSTLEDMRIMIGEERAMRKHLYELGVTKAEREIFELMGDDERKCDYCNTTCFLSAITCLCTENIDKSGNKGTSYTGRMGMAAEQFKALGPRTMHAQPKMIIDLECMQHNNNRINGNNPDSQHHDIIDLCCSESNVEQRTNVNKLVCLYHVDYLCNRCTYNDYCLKYRYTLDELPAMMNRLKTHLEYFDVWSAKVKRCLECKPISFGDHPIINGSTRDSKNSMITNVSNVCVKSEADSSTMIDTPSQTFPNPNREPNNNNQEINGVEDSKSGIVKVDTSTNESEEHEQMEIEHHQRISLEELKGLYKESLYKKFPPNDLTNILLREIEKADKLSDQCREILKKFTLKVKKHEMPLQGYYKITSLQQILSNLQALPCELKEESDFTVLVKDAEKYLEFIDHSLSDKIPDVAKFKEIVGNKFFIILQIPNKDLIKECYDVSKWLFEVKEKLSNCTTTVMPPKVKPIKTENNETDIKPDETLNVLRETNTEVIHNGCTVDMDEGEKLIPTVSIEDIEELIEIGEKKPKTNHPSLVKCLDELKEIIQAAQAWEEKATLLLESKNNSIESLETFMNEIGPIPIHLPNVFSVKDAIVSAHAWRRKARNILDGNTIVSYKNLLDFYENGKTIPVDLGRDLVVPLENILQSLDAWCDQAKRCFVKKNCEQSLQEILCPNYLSEETNKETKTKSPLKSKRMKHKASPIRQKDTFSKTLFDLLLNKLSTDAMKDDIIDNQIMEMCRLYKSYCDKEIDALDDVRNNYFLNYQIYKMDQTSSVSTSTNPLKNQVISESISKKSEFSSKKSHSSRPDKAKFCICKSGEFRKPMLCCQLCFQRYHYECVLTNKTVNCLQNMIRGQCKVNGIEYPNQLLSMKHNLQSLKNNFLPSPQPQPSPLIDSVSANNLLALMDSPYICSTCVRSRRPKLETAFSLLISLQKMPVKTIECIILQCLTERAIAWQDKVQKFLVSEPINQVVNSIRAKKMKQSFSYSPTTTKSSFAISYNNLKPSSDIVECKFVEKDICSSNNIAGDNASVSTNNTNPSNPSPIIESLITPSSITAENENTQNSNEIQTPKASALTQTINSITTLSMAKLNNTYKLSIESMSNNKKFGDSSNVNISQLDSLPTIPSMSVKTVTLLERLMFEGFIIELTMSETDTLWEVYREIKMSQKDNNVMTTTNVSNELSMDIGDFNYVCNYLLMQYATEIYHGQKTLEKDKIRCKETGSIEQPHFSTKTQSTSVVSVHQSKRKQRLVIKQDADIMLIGMHQQQAKKTAYSELLNSDYDNDEQTNALESCNNITSAFPDTLVELGVTDSTTNKRSVKPKLPFEINNDSMDGKNHGKKYQTKYTCYKHGYQNKSSNAFRNRLVNKALHRKRKVQSKKNKASNDHDDDTKCSWPECKEPMGSDINWVQCDGGCEQWFHMVCVGLRDDQLDDNDNYYCFRCKQEPALES